MRDELKALGLADETVNAVMSLHGKKMTEALNRATVAESDAAAAKAELKKYQKGGELYIDGEEHNRLKTFEKDTKNKETNAKKVSALTQLYKGANASDSVIKLLIKGQNLEEIEVDDKGNVKNGAELLKTAQADYAELFGEVGNGGAPQVPPGEGEASQTKRKKIY